MSTKTREMVYPVNLKKSKLPYIWFTILSGLFIGGTLTILSRPWGTLAPSALYSVFLALLGWVICSSSDFFKSKVWVSLTLKILPYPILILILGIDELWNGLRLWINCLISNWNKVNEGGVSLFNVGATNQSVLAISILTIFIVGEITWWVVSNRKIFLSGLFAFLLLMEQLVSGFFSPIGCALYFSAFMGLWITVAKSHPSAQIVRFFAVCTAVLCFGVAIAPADDLVFVDRFREDVKQTVHTVRYGEDILPQGDIKLADKLNKNGSQKVLKIHTEQEKSLYFRGFVGGKYENGVWKRLPDSAYSGDYSGVLDWLAEKNFNPLTQLADYYNLSKGKDIPKRNRVQVSVLNASRYYLYTPVSIQKLHIEKYSNQKDTRFVPSGFFGSSFYSVDEYSSSNPAELTVRKRWVTNPKTKEQQNYIEAETVYREFVYRNYTTANSELEPLLKSVFWKDYSSKQEGVYSALCQVRDKLKSIAELDKSPKAAPDGQDPIRYFLTKSKKGNSVLYASAAVQALRCYGIPSRYVEGYYISSDDVSKGNKGNVTLTGNNAHAWVEVYFDGIGWLPVDVTPGYYYDAVTLQRMVSAPDSAKKKAIFDDNEAGADEITESTGFNLSSLSDPVTVVKNIGLVVLGVLALIVLIITLLFILLELLRVGADHRRSSIYNKASQKEKVLMLKSQIFFTLYLKSIDGCLGWNVKDLDKMLADSFESVDKGDYERVVELMEKSIYGDVDLKEFEMRTITAFLDKISENKFKLGFKYLRIRYGWAVHLLPFYKLKKLTKKILKKIKPRKLNSQKI